MLKHASFLAVLLAGVPGSLSTRYDGHVPDGWSIIQPPTNQAGWLCANRSRQEWSVGGDSGSGALISSFTPTSTIRTGLPDGELVGTNHGEFGGKLEWFGRNAERTTIASDINPVAMTVSGNEVLVASGLAHMNHDSGQIYKLRRSSDGDWTIMRVLELGETPAAATRIDETTWMILTTTGVVVLDLTTLSAQRIYRNERWSMLYGNSIRKVGGSWLIGARRAVIRLLPGKGGYREDWIVPNGQIVCRD